MRSGCSSPARPGRIVAIVVRPLRLPYSVGLVLVGLGAGLIETIAIPGPLPAIPPEVVLVVLLPGLVFEAGYRLDLTHLRRSFTALLLLAAPGVLISAAVVAVLLNVVTGLRLDLAFIVGAMVSATDPVAVVATFRRLRRCPRDLATIVEGESLLNDGTGLVVFGIAVGALTVPLDPGGALVAFVAAIVVSAAIGLVAGFVAARLMALVDDHLIQLTISVVLAYGTYLLADGLHESGIIATVVAAVVLGNYGRRAGMSQAGTDALDTVWEFLAYLLTALVFLLVGLAFPIAELIDSLGWILVGVLGALVGRALVVYVLLGLAARFLPVAGERGGVPLGWLHVLFWAGLRGAVAVAMALALPVEGPGADAPPGDHVRDRPVHADRPGLDRRVRRPACRRRRDRGSGLAPRARRCVHPEQQRVPPDPAEQVDELEAIDGLVQGRADGDGAMALEEDRGRLGRRRIRQRRGDRARELRVCPSPSTARTAAWGSAGPSRAGRLDPVRDRPGSARASSAGGRGRPRRHRLARRRSPDGSEGPRSAGDRADPDRSAAPSGSARRGRARRP